MIAVVALLGALAGAAIAVAATAAWRAAPPLRVARKLHRLTPARLAVAAATGLAVALVTRWPVATALAAWTGYVAPTLIGGKAARDAELARVEALAGWAEMLRDTMAAASGIEQSIRSTAALAPTPIRTHTRALAARLEHQRQPLDKALRAFADDIADPTADLVVSALLVAAQGGAGRLGQVLSAVASIARSEVTMRQRVEAGRARTRASVRIITLFTLGFTLMLLLFNRDYLAPYADAGGQLVLAVVGGMYGAAYWWLAREARTERAERFLEPGRVA